jgi:pimeloyl-ACP methyl ester carboxylesterase
VFVLGHSQGGMMAPRIGARDPGMIAGLVLLAAPARSLLDIVIEQNRRLAVLDDGKTSDAERDRDHRADPAACAAPAMAATDDRHQDRDGPAAGYWRSIDSVDAVAEAKSVALPMLVLQGARDIQVVDADWQAWRGAFHDNAEGDLQAVRHAQPLGDARRRRRQPAEYQQPNHVDPTLIDDVASWIKAR